MTDTLRRIIVSVSDLERALGFYRDLLGLEARVAPGLAQLILGEADVEVLLHERPTIPSDTAVAIAFCVPDVDAACGAWEERGHAVVDHPADQPCGERMAVVRDADGRLVCLVRAGA